MNRLACFHTTLAIALFFLPAAHAQTSAEIADVEITLKTTKGDIEAVIFASKTPITAANFLNLAARNYYDGLSFHRVIPDFMIQGGCPLGTGTGTPGYNFDDEIHPGLRHDGPGMFSMANRGLDPRTGGGTNGSQFFITHTATPHLNGKHSVFGKVTRGQDVVDSIVKGDTIVDIIIRSPADNLFAAQELQINEWNKHLAARGR
jgi:peptidyl-prolyl cis-trans isomerase B (cyclophilin B)